MKGAVWLNGADSMRSKNRERLSFSVAYALASMEEAGRFEVVRAPVWLYLNDTHYAFWKAEITDEVD